MACAAEANAESRPGEYLEASVGPSLGIWDLEAPNEADFDEV